MRFTTELGDIVDILSFQCVIEKCLKTPAHCQQKFHFSKIVYFIITIMEYLYFTFFFFFMICSYSFGMYLMYF